MQVQRMVLGELYTNCYLIIKGKHCLIIDPASEASKIIEACKGYQVDGILVTHHHFDHIGALKELETYYKLRHNDHLNNGFSYEVIKTPGHTDDSVSFYFRDEKIMFSGDFLFYHTIGRCDFENSSVESMKDSLHEIKKYPDDIIVYPGHGVSTVLGEEKKLFDTYF